MPVFPSLPQQGKDLLTAQDVARRLSIGVTGDADDSSRDVSLEFVSRREIRGVRPAVAERNSKPLGVADDDISTPLARWNKKDQQRSRAAPALPASALARLW